jgi:prohibitin 1
LLLLSTVEGGRRAVLFDQFQGVSDKVRGEGTHFIVPVVQRPIIYDVRSQPRNIPVITPSKGKEGDACCPRESEAPDRC